MIKRELNNEGEKRYWPKMRKRKVIQKMLINPTTLIVVIDMWSHAQLTSKQQWLMNKTHILTTPIESQKEIVNNL